MFLVLYTLGNLAVPAAFCGLTTSFIAKRYVGRSNAGKWLYLKHFFALWVGGALSGGLFGASWGSFLFGLYLLSPLALAVVPFIKSQHEPSVRASEPEPSVPRSRTIRPSLQTVARALDQREASVLSPPPAGLSLSSRDTRGEERTSTSGWSRSIVGALALIVIVASGVAGKVGVRALFDHRRSALFDDALAETSKQINATLPMQVDRSTRLDSTAAGPGNRMTYVYTAVDLSAGSADAAAISAALKPQLINGYKTTPELAPFREKQVRCITFTATDTEST